MTHYWMYGILAGIAVAGVFGIFYRRAKRYSRRCGCGSTHFRWFHKVQENPKRGEGWHDTYTFRDCHKCMRFVLVKSDTRFFNPWGVYRRKMKHEFDGVMESLVRAGIPLESCHSLDAIRKYEPNLVIPEPVICVQANMPIRQALFRSVLVRVGQRPTKFVPR